ncbi:MAG: zinc-binding dehydrogenase [Hyphomonadaceae bacterium]
MRALTFETPGKKLRCEEIAEPKPGPGQIKLKVKHCGVCGSDLHMTEAAASRNPTPGSVIGHEFCGEIVELGEGVDRRWKEGDRITALPFMGCGACAYCQAGEPVWCAKMISHAGGRVQGGFAEYVVVGAGETVRVPDQLSWTEGALIEPIAVGLHGVELAELKPGANIFVLGAGPIGLATVACARAMGAGKIVVAAKSDRRADLARAMGATDFILADENAKKEFKRIVGGPPDAVFECVGAPGMLEFCISQAAPRTTVTVLGACNQRDSYNPVPTLGKELRLQFSMAYHVRDFERAAAMMADGRVKTEGMVTDIVNFAQFPDAFEALRERTHQCKVLLAPEMP